MMGVALAAWISLVILHRVDGGAVAVAPSHITSMHARAPSTGQNKLVTGEARCIVWLSDGKLLSVLESCETVKQLLDEAAHK